MVYGSVLVLLVGLESSLNPFYSMLIFLMVDIFIFRFPFFNVFVLYPFLQKKQYFIQFEVKVLNNIKPFIIIKMKTFLFNHSCYTYIFPFNLDIWIE